jgi:TetR/AcrR family transcriptional regulator, mexJK operon transcriptional repressor
MSKSTKASIDQATAKRQWAKSRRRRPRRPSLNDEQLMDKALDLFLEHGYERTSVETITRTAGMAKRTFYLRYGDKKSLFIAALQRAIEEWIVPIERLRAAERDSLEASLLAIGQILVANALSPAGLRLLRLTNSESGHMPEIGEFTVKLGTDRTIHYLADLFRRQVSSSDNQPLGAEDAAEAFLHLVVGGPANAAAWGLERDLDAVSRRISFSVKIFMQGIFSQLGKREDAHISLQREYLRYKKLIIDATVQLNVVEEKLKRVGLQPE